MVLLYLSQKHQQQSKHIILWSWQGLIHYNFKGKISKNHLAHKILSNLNGNGYYQLSQAYESGKTIDSENL
jgi:hypothetical protein